MGGRDTPSAESPAVCPECATRHTKPAQLMRTRRRKKLALAALVGLVFGGYGMWVVPRVQTIGASGVIPTTPMVLIAPWLPPVQGNQVVVIAPGPLPPPGLVGSSVAHELEERLDLMSPASAHVADWWWAVWDGDGVDGTPIGFPTRNPVKWQFRYEMLAAGRFSEAQTLLRLTEVIDTTLAELELRAGIGQMGRWRPAPRPNVETYVGVPLPKGWRVEWIELRDGPGADARLELNGQGTGTRDSSENRAWTGDEAVYRVTLHAPGQIEPMRWRVTYDILRGEDAETRFATQLSFEPMIAVPTHVLHERDEMP